MNNINYEFSDDYLLSNCYSDICLKRDDSNERFYRKLIKDKYKN